MGVYCWILWRLTRYCNLHQKGDRGQLLEALLFSPITVTNLQNTKSSKIFRRISTYLIFITTTVVLIIIYYQEIQDNTTTYSWYLDIVSVSIGLGLVSFFMDMLYSIIPFFGPIFFKNWRNTSKKRNLDNEKMDVHHYVDEETVMERSLKNLDQLNEDELELVKRCLSNEKDVDEKMHDGMTALMISAKYNYSDILCQLLLKGAKINLQDKNGKTAKTYAINR